MSRVQEVLRSKEADYNHALSALESAKKIAKSQYEKDSDMGITSETLRTMSSRRVRKH
jgi:hypothetical protein